MKKNLLTIAVACALFSAPAFAVQDANDAQVRDSNDARVDHKVAGMGSTKYPAASGRNFTIIKGGVGTGLDIGCAGADLENLLRSYFNVDFKSVIEYISSNAAGFALTYLIYSNPTLYSLLQDLKKAGDFALNLNMLSCSNIRDSAGKARTRAIEAEGKSKCVAERGAQACEDTNISGPYMKQAVDEYEKKIQAKSYSANATVNNFLTGEMELSPEIRELINAMVPTEKPSGGEMQKTSPSKTVSILMRESYDKRLEIIRKMVEAKRAKNVKLYGDLGEQALRDGIEPINDEVIGKIEQYPSREREVVMRRFAARQAFGDVVAKLRQVSEVIRVGMLKGDRSVTLFDYQKVEVRDALAAIDNMINMLRLEYEALDDQRSYMLNIIQNAPTGLK